MEIIADGGPSAVHHQQSAVMGSSNEQENLSIYFVRLSDSFNGFRAESDYEEFYNMLVESYGNHLEEIMQMKCNKTSSYIFKTILAFQHLTTLRLTYIEGNHHHVIFFQHYQEYKY